MGKRTCSVSECSSPHLARGFCRLHYKRWHAHGDPLAVDYVRGDDQARFRSYCSISDSTGCWLWTGTVATSNGYAQFWAQGRHWKGHVWAWTQKHGPVPDGKQLDHFECDTLLCVNPDHVRPVTAWENTLRSSGVTSLNKAKTHCKHGHEFTPQNTRRVPGGRGCKACTLRRGRERRERLRTSAEAS